MQFGRNNRKEEEFNLALLIFACTGIPMIILAVLKSKSSGIIIGIIAIILGMIGMIYLIFAYSQSLLFCVDGAGPIKSMKLSRMHMKGQKIRLLCSIFPTFLWLLLAEIVAETFLYLPALVIQLRGGFSLIGIVFYGCAFMVGMCAMMLPVILYMLMISTVFYDDLNGRTMNPIRERSKKPIVTVVILTLVLSLLSCILVALPVLWKDQAWINSLQLQGNTSSTAVPGESKPEVKTETPPEKPTEKPETESNPAPQTGSTESIEGKIRYSWPAGYTEFDKTETSMSAFNEENDAIFVNKMDVYDEEDPLDFYREYYGAKDVAIGTIIGVEYTENDYYFVFVKDNYQYVASGDKEADVKEFIKSIK